MKKTLKCSRCREEFVQNYKSKLGQICSWCEEDLIALDRELSYKCGILPMTKRDIQALNQYWLLINAG
jgi:hypothetical protein